MNQEKIGKFIASERKKRKLTQIELAEKIGVSNSAVSKWETGNGMPDYSVFNNLCKEFNITVNELLAGERNSKDNNVISEYIRVKDKKNKLNIIITILISLLIILCVIFGTFFFNSYKSITMYEFVGENDNFRYDNATYLESKIKTIFTGGQFKIVNSIISEEDILDKKLAIKDNDKYYNFGNVYPGSLSYEDYLYGDKFSIAELRHLPNDLYLIVWYRFDGEILYDVIKLEYKEILSNDKLVDIKSEHIAEVPNKELKEEINLNKYNGTNYYRDYLISKGFKKADKCEKIEGECTLLEKKIKDETIYIDYLNKMFYWEIKGEDKVESWNHFYEPQTDGQEMFNGDKIVHLRVYEMVDRVGNIYKDHKYNIEEKTIDFKEINKNNEKYMKYFNRFIELYNLYRPQDE